jgi:hypothetical protein
VGKIKGKIRLFGCKIVNYSAKKNKAFIDKANRLKRDKGTPLPHTPHYIPSLF